MRKRITKIINVSILLFILVGCSKSESIDKTKILTETKHDIEIAGWSSAIGAESENNTDIQDFEYWIDIANYDNVKKTLKSIEPEINENFKENIIDNIDKIEVNKTLNPYESTKINFKLKFNAKGLSKENILSKGQCIKGFKLITERTIDMKLK